VIQNRLKRQARVRAAQIGIRLGKQVRVGDVQDPDWIGRFTNGA
jgi:hypothetical protein